MKRKRLVLFLVLASVLSVLAASVSVEEGPLRFVPHTESALASVPSDIPKPSGCSDPWACYRAGAYSATEEENIVTRLAGWGNVYGDGGTIEDFYGTGRTVNQHEYLASRLDKAMQQAGVRPATTTVVDSAWYSSRKLVPLAARASLALAAGYVVFKLVTTDWHGNTHDTYYTFRKEALGGALVTLPSSFSGPTGDVASAADMIVCNLNTAGSANVTGTPPTPICVPFGWEYKATGCRLNGSSGQPCWMFSYSIGAGYGSVCTNPAPITLCYPGTGPAGSAEWKWSFTTYPGNFSFKIPDISTCASILSTCYGSTGSGAHAGVQLAIGQAASATIGDLDGSLNPLPVHVDYASTATNHLLAGTTCTSGGGGTAASCHTAYVKAVDWERLAPRRETRDNITGTTPEQTVTNTVASNPSHTERTDITDELDDPCGRLIFNHMVMPDSYPHYECDPDHSNPDDGDTVPEVNPAPNTYTFTPFAIPEPLPTEAYPQYISRLRDRGWVGTATTIPSGIDSTAIAGSAYALSTDTRVTGVALNTGSVLLFDGDGDPLSWPANPPVVQTAETPIQVEFKPEDGEFPVDPEPGVGAGGGGGAFDCNCTVRDFDFSPFGAIDTMRFPFGVFPMALDIADTFDVAPVAPVITLDFPDFAGVNLPPYIVDLGDPHLDTFYDYLGIVRMMTDFLLWVGALWFVGSRLLGFGASGDPADAAVGMVE